jgi:hypothetical protein
LHVAAVASKTEVTVVFASKQQGFLGAVTMVTAAGVLQVNSPFFAIPPPAFPSGARSRLLPLPATPVNAQLMNSAFPGGTTDTRETHDIRAIANHHRSSQGGRASVGGPIAFD